MIVIAHSIRSIYNVGAIFRVCDGLGVEKLFLVGYIATPKTQEKKLAKTALGSEQAVPWEYRREIGLLIARLKSDGYEIVGLEEKQGLSIDYRDWQPSAKVAIILGNEVRGISTPTLRKCDKVVKLAMRGKKNSLNVATALAGIGYYLLARE